VSVQVSRDRTVDSSPLVTSGNRWSRSPGGITTDAMPLWWPAKPVSHCIAGESGGVDACPLPFMGQYADGESGWAYNRLRFYDSAAGVYGAQDSPGKAPKDHRDAGMSRTYECPCRHVPIKILRPRILPY
jgi:RHS repeat-associated protein